MKKERAFATLIIFPCYFYRYTHTPFDEAPILFGKTLYNLPNCVHQSPIATLSAVSKNRARLLSRCRDICRMSVQALSPSSLSTQKRGSPVTLVNPSKPEIFNQKPRFRFFQAILLRFHHIVSKIHTTPITYY